MMVIICTKRNTKGTKKHLIMETERRLRKNTCDLIANGEEFEKCQDSEHGRATGLRPIR